jgi:hypothetical protein
MAYDATHAQHGDATSAAINATKKPALKLVFCALNGG